MNVASLERCGELYKLSGWEFGHMRYDLTHRSLGVNDGDYKGKVPAYDLGYLLRKLPAHFNTGDARGAFEFFLKTTGREWFAGYNKPELGKWLYDNNHGVWETPCSADTPEDAAAGLAIQLFKQGILKKRGEDE